MAPTTRKKPKPKPVSESESEEPDSEPGPPKKHEKRKVGRKKRKFKSDYRKNESSQQRARRLVREKERVRRRRANETPEQREHRLKVARETRRRRYQMLKAAETPEEREERMKVESDMRWMQRKCETEEQRRARQKRDAARQRDLRRQQKGLDPTDDYDSELDERRKLSRKLKAKVACPVCSVQVQEDYLETHLLRHQGGENARPFRCSQCPKTYIQFSHLKEHRLRHFTNTPLEDHEFYCEMCSIIIYGRVRYINHVRSHVRKSGLQLSESEPIFIYICDFDCCQLCFRDKRRFISHLESHSAARLTFDCTICKKPFAKESNCKIHTEVAHKPDSDNIIDCPYCHFVIENKDEDWEWHHKSHQIRLDERPVGTHLCEECGKTYHTANNLKSHIQRIHERPPGFSWGKKSKSARSEESLKEAANRSLFPTTTYPCKVCGKFLPRRMEFYNHMLRVHTYQHGLECYACGKHYDHLHTLNIHIRKLHQTDDPKLTKRAQCLYCERDFSGYMMKNKHHFYAHREEYLRVKPFCCSVCYRNFPTVEDLSTHQLVHEKWKCSVCNLCQISQKTFDLHMRTHNLGPLATGKTRTYKQPRRNRKSEFYPMEVEERAKLNERSANHFYQDEVLRVEIQTQSGIETEVIQVQQEEYDANPNSAVDYSQQWQDVTQPDVAANSRSYGTTEPIRILYTRALPSTETAKSTDGIPTENTEVATMLVVPESQTQQVEIESEIMPPPVIVPPKKYKCDRCPRQFTYPKHLVTHINWHIGDETGDVDLMKMQADTVVFTEQSDLELEKYRNSEYVEDEADKERFVCTDCEESFSHRTNLNKHRRIIHGVVMAVAEARQYKCDFCPRTFSRESNLHRHLQIVHKDVELEEAPEALTTDVDFKPYLDDAPATPWEWGTSQADEHNEPIDSDMEPDPEPPAASNTEEEQKRVRTSVRGKRKQEQLPIKPKKVAENQLQQPKNKKRKLESVSIASTPVSANKFKCNKCPLTFRREITLRKHQQTHEEHENAETEWIFSDIKEEPYDDDNDVDWHAGGEETYSDPETPTFDSTIVKYEYLPSIHELKIRNSQLLAKLSPDLRVLASSYPQCFIPLPKTDAQGSVKVAEEEDEDESEEDSWKPIKLKLRVPKSSRKTRKSKSTASVSPKAKIKSKPTNANAPKRSHKKKTAEPREPRPPRVLKPKPPVDPNAPVRKKREYGPRQICEICNKDFHPNMDMKVHMATHSGVKPYKCEECLKFFDNKRQLSAHMREKHDELPAPKRAVFDNSEYYCDICFITVKYRRRYDRHMRTHLELEPSLKTVLYMYQCDACPNAYRQKDHFHRHLESHCPNDPKIASSCSICDKVFAKLETLETHVKTVHEAEGTIYDCNYCHHNFTDEEEFKTHEEVHTVDLASKEVGTNMCFHCGMTFLHIATLNGHIIQMHNGEGIDPRAKPRVHLRKNQGGKVSHNEKAPCQVCGKSFGVRTALKTHLLKDHTYEHGLFCYICNRKFACLAPLYRHIIDFHKEEAQNPTAPYYPQRVLKKRTMYSCTYCDVQFRGEPLRLQKHCFTEHQDEYLQLKPFYCELCFKNFETSGELDDHRSVHDRLKCTHCGKQFLRQDYFNVHKLRHEGEREFECTMCDKKFTTVYNLRDHEKRHTKEYAYFCSFCPKETAGFYKKVYLDKHIEKMHAITELQHQTVEYSIMDSNSNNTVESSEDLPSTQIIAHPQIMPGSSHSLRFVHHPPISILHPSQFLLERLPNPHQQQQPTTEELHFTMDSFLY